jgi:hypothetical protein
MNNEVFVYLLFGLFNDTPSTINVVYCQMENLRNDYKLQLFIVLRKAVVTEAQSCHFCFM